MPRFSQAEAEGSDAVLDARSAFDAAEEGLGQGSRAAGSSFLGIYEYLVRRLLDRIRYGRVDLVAGGERRSYGDPDSHLEATLTVHDRSFFRDVVRRGEVGLGQSYVAEKWSSPNLDDLMLVLQWNIEAFVPMMRSGAVQLFSRLLEGGKQKWLSNGRTGTLDHSKDAMSVCYDVGNDFFRLGLGPSMQYSCAIWARPEDSLEQAQQHKLDILINKLDLSPEHRVLDIGCGWGTLLKEIHARVGCEVHGISLAREQVDYCRESCPEGRFDYLDYREISGETYDRIVSVGMMEHIGYEHLQTFFDRVAGLLAPGGRAVLHTMISGDALDVAPGVHFDAFVYTIMPLGYLAIPRELHAAIQRTRDLHLVHSERFGPHYGRTFRAWRRNLQEHREAVAELYSPEHVRVYDYLWGSSAGCFTAGNSDLLQMVIGKGPPANDVQLYDPRA